MKTPIRHSRMFVFVGAIALVFVTSALAHAASSQYKVIYAFTDSTHGSIPNSGLIRDASGNFYGVTGAGGDLSCNDGDSCGTVYRLAPNADGTWTQTVLYSFTDADDHRSPSGNLALDSAGNLYGTTTYGGNVGAFDCQGIGCGVVFKLTPNPDGSWTQTVLYRFSGADGSGPTGGLVVDSSGNLYGTTQGGGTGVGCTLNDGCGTLFKLTPNSDGTWTESVLYSFTENGGTTPTGSLILDGVGNLYGTTRAAGPQGWGVVFQLQTKAGGNWEYNVLLSPTFGNVTGTVTLDSAGNLYGSTTNGGSAEGGEVFKLTPQPNGKWVGNKLFTFSGKYGKQPNQGIVIDSAGNLYGTTALGGAANDGAVFELSPQSTGGWLDRPLHMFSGNPAMKPLYGPTFDAAGNLYGTTSTCGINCGGAIFEVTP